MGLDLLLGGKVMVFRGDFRQALLIVRRGNRAPSCRCCSEQILPLAKHAAHALGQNHEGAQAPR